MQIKVLVVDDVADILHLFKHLLNQLGYQDITLVSTGKEALEIIQNEQFDLAFLDIELPDLCGTVILDQIQASDSNTDVVMCSAHNSVENVKLTWDKGAKGFLTKPISPHKLKNLLKRLNLETVQVA
ncbi:response regulator [Psychrosphaera sp. B3R10]|uniref:Response regulator n=1 Tax=Psychrosphaera algicola TaxID=3023714 RepID=A0ABT5F8D3_9GAMM|nr:MULTISPECIES: response regulator [unclassified Psychrosphaera]MBU2882204.1 response regulator [Psychrosphaera sp. I2R16]MBU2988885.1 response regulator [Psychrosphaera sp. B3R10]MDC2887804.1 response regulator [Psychrosphaera sp. G1-22]MDO6717904.1 response regulator [Psychrosphaera sp. 1_MG-2023]